MLSRDYRDIVGGGILVLGGILFSRYAWTHYDLGELRRMGPGMFPAALGIALVFFGALVAIPAFFRQGPMPKVTFWAPLFMLAGVAGFAATIRPFGLMPAALAVVFISSFAELKVLLLTRAILCAVLCLVAWLIFRVGLGLPIDMWRWPF